MSKLNKTSSGLLLYENFEQNSLIWTPSPNNYMNLEFGKSGLRFIHSDTYKTFTIQEPQDNYCFICKLNHVPINANDIGGVVVMSNDTSYLECQSYVASKHSYVTNSDETKQQILDFIDAVLDKYVEYSVTDDYGTYPEDIDDESSITNTDTGDSVNKTFEDVMYAFIKVIKNNGIYSFFASTDGKEWVEVGNSKFADSHRIGFFLYSIDSLSEEDLTKSNFYVEYAMFYDNNYVIIKNIKDEYKIELRDPDGSIVIDDTQGFITKKDNSVYIDTTLLKMPYNNVRLVILNSSEQIVFDYYIDQLIGGDNYEYGYDLKVFVDNIEINQEELFKLSAFNTNNQTVRIDIYNQEEFEITDLKISIASYSIYYNGNETLGISLYDTNEENYNFQDSVIINSIMPSEGRSVLIKLTDKTIQDFYRKEGVYRFKLNIE